MKIAIVDDDTNALETLTAAVKKAGFDGVVPIHVQFSTTIDAVLKELAGMDMVLLDHQMCHFSGEKVARMISQEIILVTTSEHQRAKAYCTKELLGKNSRHQCILDGMAVTLKQLVSQASAA